jgi:hypothetical protein
VNERESKRDSPFTEETYSILESIVRHERHPRNTANAGWSTECSVSSGVSSRLGGAMWPEPMGTSVFGHSRPKREEGGDAYPSNP